MIPPRWLYRVGWAMHNLVHGLSGGRLGTARPRGTRVGVLFLSTVGARSGGRRRNALNYLEDGRNLLLIASNAGAPGNPGWWHNLRANPDATIEIGGHTSRVRARPATGAEAAAAWMRFQASSRQYAAYRRATGREIPIVVLEPNGGSAHIRASHHEPTD
jgi:deazaflavin-dependent oxidoreductase (nitroreductase family)